MTLATVNIHGSQFPEQVLEDLKECLRSRQVNQKFHYATAKQARQWLRLHEAFSPARTDPNCLEIYRQCFVEAARQIAADKVQVVGLGCGGGQKDVQLIELLQAEGKEVTYLPVDVSLALVLTARQAVLQRTNAHVSAPLVCDLALVDDLHSLLEQSAVPGATRCITFFGLIPNFVPGTIMPRLAGCVGKSDVLLFSANLAPGPDYAQGVDSILPLYDNELTREWLLTFLLDLGVDREAGEVTVSVEALPSDGGLRRVAAWFTFRRASDVHVDGEMFRFVDGDRVRLFFSYRHTVEGVRALLKANGLESLQTWVTTSGEEGAFLVAAGS